MNISEKPDGWVILQITENNKIYYKVFGTWRGGDRWKINSGIKSVSEDDEFYYFHGYTGSCYRCAKNGYGASSFYCEVVLLNIIEKSENSAQVLDKNTDWISLINSQIGLH